LLDAPQLAPRINRVNIPSDESSDEEEEEEDDEGEGGEIADDEFGESDWSDEM
jgi:hypothetical protein